MKLWLISQDVNHDYDTFDSAIVAAESELEAKWIHPGKENWNGTTDRFSTWCDVKDVKVKLIGTAIEGTEKGVICASYNAG